MSLHWHSIRPWSPRLVLQVKHVSSVAATFTLSPADDGNATRSISDMLGTKGVALTVNGTSWPRVFVHMDEAANEAVVVVVGLAPARQYDIELRIDSSDEQEPAVAVIDTSPTDDVADIDDDDVADHVSDEDGLGSVPSTPTLAPTPPREHTPSPTLEERAAQFRARLSGLSSEQLSLTEQLKQTRRDLQRAEAALRAEIDTLRRASEKASAAELRSKQKVLALQEAVKQSLAATSEAKDEATTIEDTTTSLRAQEEELEAQVAALREEASMIHDEVEESIAADTRRLNDSQQELAAYETRSEKLAAKKTRLDEQEQELEERLVTLVRENEQLEADLAPRPTPRIPLAPNAHSLWSGHALGRPSTTGSH